MKLKEAFFTFINGFVIINRIKPLNNIVLGAVILYGTVIGVFVTIILLNTYFGFKEAWRIYILIFPAIGAIGWLWLRSFKKINRTKRSRKA